MHSNEFSFVQFEESIATVIRIGFERAYFDEILELKDQEYSRGDRIVNVVVVLAQVD
jgi:hypothetical protein